MRGPQKNGRIVHIPGCTCGKCDGRPRSSGRLATLAELMRMGYHDMVIRYGTRCPQHNKAEGGAAMSGHLAMWGDDGNHSVAFDGKLAGGWSLSRQYQFLFDAIRAGARGVGLYPWGFHLDLKPRLKIWRSVNGKPVYF